MARKRKRRAAAVTTSSKLTAAKEAAMAITSPPLKSAAALPVLRATSKKNANNSAAPTATKKLLPPEKEEINSTRISPANNLIDKQEQEPQQPQQPLSTTTATAAASCRRKQAKPQRKNVDSELETELPTLSQNANNAIVENYTSNSTTTCLSNIADNGVNVDSGVDSESTTTTPSSPEEGMAKDHVAESKLPPEDENNRVDSDVMETAEMLLSLSGSSNAVTTTAMRMNGSNNEYKASSSYLGLKDDFIRSLRLQKKEKATKNIDNSQHNGNCGKNTGKHFKIVVWISRSCKHT